jgi:hypothetical protein
VKRNGDEMRGDLQFVDGVAVIEFLDASGGTRHAAIRVNGNDLEFQDITNGAPGTWISLLSLKAGGLVVAFEQEFITVGGETFFVLTGGNSYVPGTGTVLINRNGILLPRTEFVETSPTRVDLAGTQPPVAAGEKIVVFVMAGTGVDTFAVKGDAADGTPSNLNNKLGNGSGLTKAVTGSPGNSVVNLAVDHATAVPLQSTGAGSVGVATKSAREDHVHPAPAAPATMLVQANGSYVGNGIALPRRSIVTGLTTLYFLLLHNETAGSSANTWRLFINAASGTKIGQASASTFAIGAGTIQIVGGNFEVTNGDGTNTNLTNYKWFAIGL